MKISVILTFLLSWNFASSNPHQKSNDKSVDELNYKYDSGSDSSNLARTESSDDASSGKDWGGDTLSQRGFDIMDENDDADSRPFLLTLIPEGSEIGTGFADEIVGGIKKMTGTSTSKNELSDIPSNGKDSSDNNHNKITPSEIRENIETLAKFFDQNDEEEFALVDEKMDEHGTRARRDLQRGSISENLLKLTEGSTSNVLRSEKATVAEALNGRAAIRKILERARERTARVMPYKDLYNSDDFGKWLLSGSSFDTNIFRHSHNQPSMDTEIEQHPDTENTDDLRYRTFLTPRYRTFDPTNRHHNHHHHHLNRHREGKSAFNILSDPSAVDNADTEHTYAKLLHTSKHRESLSPKLQITSGEKRSRDETGGMFRKPTTVSQHAHRSLSYEDDTADDSGLQYYSHAYVPHWSFRVTEDEDTDNSMPKWRHAKWIHRFGTHAPDSEDSLKFQSGEEMDDYKKRLIFWNRFDGLQDEETDDWEARAGRRRHGISSEMDIYGKIDGDSWNDEETKLTTSDSHGKTMLGRKRYYYGIGDREHSVYDNEADTIASGDTENRHLTDFLVERTSSMDSRGEKNIRNKNIHLGHDGIQRSASYSTTSAETTGEVAEKQSGNALITEISTGMPTWKAADIDIEHYNSRNRHAAGNSATSLSSSLSAEKESERTNNAFASLSVDDGSTGARRKETKSGDYGVLRRTRPVIDNDATAAEIEMGFSGIKSHPRADLPWAHSSLSRTRSKTHLGNQGAHRGINGHSTADAVASTETKLSMDSGGDALLGRVKTQKTLPAGEYENYDLRENNEVNGDAESSAEATSLIGSERYDLLRTASSDDLREQDYVGTRREHGNRRTAGRHKTSMEMIDIPDRRNEEYTLIPEFPVYKFRKGYWPYINYYDPNIKEISVDDPNIEVGESIRDWKGNEINYGTLEREETFPIDDMTLKKPITAISNAYEFDDRRSHHRKHGEYNQRSRYDHHAFDQSLRNITWSSSIMSDISEYEAWKRYIEYLYYVLKLKRDNSGVSFDTSTFTTEKSQKQNNAIDEEISLDRRERKHMTDEDNQIYLKKHKKRPHYTGKFLTKNIHGLTQDKINNRKTTNENYGDEEGTSEDNVNNQSENHKTLMHTKNVMYDDSIADMSKTSSNKRIIDNNNYRQQNSWNSLSMKDSYADTRTETNVAYDPYRRKEDIDTNIEQTTEMDSADSENNFRSISTKIFPTSGSYMESQLNQQTLNKLNNIKQIWTQTSNKKGLYHDENDLRHISMTSSKLAGKPKIKRIHRLKEQSKTDEKDNASIEALTETVSSSGTVNKYRSDVRDMSNMATSKLSAVSQVGSEHHFENLKNEKHDTNAEATADVISMQDAQKLIAENTSLISKSSVESEKEIDNYSNENTRNIQISTINSGTSTVTSPKLLTKSKEKTEQTENNFKNVQMNTNAQTSATTMLSDNTRHKWSTSSSELSKKSRVKSGHYLTNHENSRINTASSASAGSTISNVIEDKRESHLQRSLLSPSSTSSEKLQEESQHHSNSIQNSQMNVATAESSIESTFLTNTESGHWSDSSKSSLSSKSLKEAHKQSSSDITNIQENNIEHRSELESMSSSKSQVKSKLKNEDYSSFAKSNKKNVVNVDASLGATSSAGIKVDHQQESISSSSSSCSVAESQVKNRNTETSMLSTISNNVVKDINERNLLHMLSLSQTANKNYLKIQEDDPQTASKSAMFEMSTYTNDDKRRRENNALKATWFNDPKIRNNMKISTGNEIIGKGETVKKSSENTLNAATSATAVTSNDIRNMQNSITTSLIDSKPKTKIYSENLNQLKRGEAVTDDNSAISRTLNEIDNDKDISSLSESHSISAEKRRHNIDTVQESQGSLATKSISFESSEEAQQKQRNFNIHREKSENTANEATLETSDNVNKYRDSALGCAASDVSYNKLQTNDKLRNKNGASARDSVEMSKFAILRNNGHKHLGHISLYDYRGEGREENEINSRSSLTHAKDISDVNDMISTKLGISTISNNMNRSNLQKIISSDNSHAESLQKEDKADIHSGVERTVSTGITSYDDKQAYGNTLWKLIFRSNPGDKTQMTYREYYDILTKLTAANDNKEFNEDNMRKWLSSGGLRVKNENVESTAHAKKSVKDATNAFTSMDTTNVNFKGNYQDDPIMKFIANVQDRNQLESTFSIDTKARSEIDQKSSISRKNGIINTDIRDTYNINKWRTKYQTAESSSHAKMQGKTENALKMEVSTESITSKNNENSHDDDSIREKSYAISSSLHNYGDQRADIGNAAKAKASAETSISNISPIAYRDDAKETSAISQLKRHDLYVREGDKAIGSNVLLSTQESKSNRMQNTQQQKLSGIALSNSHTKVQHEEIGDIAKEDLEVTANAATSAQTTSSETVESESREKLIGVSSQFNSYAKSQRGSKHRLNAVLRGEQIVARAKADSAVSNNLESVRQSDLAEKDSLFDPSRNTYAKVENKNVLENNLANAVDATTSTKESSYGVIKDKGQSGVTTTALVSNSQEQHERNSSVRRESIETTSSGDIKDADSKTENIVNSMGANLKAAANTVTFGEAISSNNVRDLSKILSSANSYAESRTDNMRTLNAARNSQETTNTRASATLFVSTSVDEQGKHTYDFVGEKSNADSQIRRRKIKAENSGQREDPRNSKHTEASGQATSFSDAENELQENNEYDSRILQKQRSTAFSNSKTFDYVDSIQRNNLKELTATTSSDAHAESNVENENHVNVLAKDHTNVLDASAQTMTSNEFRITGEDQSLHTASSSDAYANAQAINENTNGIEEDSAAVVNAKTETATSTDIKNTNQYGLFDLLAGAATRTRTKGETVSQEGVIKEDLSGASSDAFSEAGVENASAKILGSKLRNYELSAAVNAIAETESGDQRDQQGASRGTVSSSGDIRDSQLDVTKSTSSANSYAAEQIMDEGVSRNEKAEIDPEISISTLEAPRAHNQVKGTHANGWLVTTSDAGARAEERAQNKDKFNVLREVKEVAVYAGTSAGAADAGNVESEQRDARAEKLSEHQSGLNVATKTRNTVATSGASAKTTASVETKNRSENESISGGEITTSSFDKASAETRVRTEENSNVFGNSESSFITDETQSSTTSAASSVSASASDNLDMNHRARYHRIDNGMSATSAIAPASNEIHLSSGEITILYPSREITKCDENVETREFISEATSLYQMLDKQRGSEILLMKKNPRGPVQMASLKNSVPPLIAYRLIPREVYERIRAIIANNHIFCADCAFSST